MILKHLIAHNFKNIESADVDFCPNINGLIGNNGMGKSNLLDAIYYLSFCRSFSGLQDKQLVKKGETFMMLSGDYLRSGVEEDVKFGFSLGKKKSLKRKGKEYSRLSQHIGLFPLVLVAPQDINLITGASEDRRAFLDKIISQSDKQYLDSLIRYSQLLEQRNKLLKDKHSDSALFEAIEIQMQITADYIAKARRTFVDSFSPIFNDYYSRIADTNEEVCIGYTTTVTESGTPLTSQFDECRRRDEYLGFTTVGVHRDDIEMQMNGMPVKRIASQGQCKTYVISMRLAQYDFLSRSTGLKPLLLLDDIFDKLDSTRVERIIELVAGDKFGQIFITDTNRSHLDSIMKHINGEYKLMNVENGIFKPV